MCKQDDFDEIRTISIKEFREKGYLQELNRQFLHPLGLALAVKIDDLGCESLDRVWDYRADLEGVFYNLQNSSDDRKERFKKNIEFIATEREKRSKVRKEKLGFEIENI